mgnify:CR=1 FL=1
MLEPGKERYTFADIMASPDTEWVEIIHGKLYPMTPLGTVHQTILMALMVQITNQLKGQNAEAIHLIAVRPFEGPNDTPELVDTVLLPDISILCAPRKFEEYGCKGVPDFIAEIVSPTSRYMDTVLKLDIYQNAGIREYWVIDPESKSINIYVRDYDSKGLHLSNEKICNGTIELSVLEGVSVNVNELFVAKINSV